MGNKIQISEMFLFDLDNIKDILVSDFDDFWNYSILKDELSNANSYYLVAKLDNEILGFAGIKYVLNDADIMNIVVKKSKRKSGIGSLLLKNIIELCKKLNVSTLFLEVNEKNLPAISLYKKFGFEEVGFRKNYYKENNAIVMKKENL